VLVAVAIIAGRAILSMNSHTLYPSLGAQLTGRVGVQASGSCSSSSYPAGAEYTFERCTSSGDPVTWARCSTLTYSVDPAGAPPGYLADVRKAIDELNVATGLRLTQRSGTAFISIAWDPSMYNPRPGAAGEAGVTRYQVVSDPFGAHFLKVSIRISSHLEAGPARRAGEEPVLLHELGHAVGLGHNPAEVVMNPVDQGFTSYQAGDLAGLKALYHPASCGHS
jgi:hypothetical protein